MTQSGAFKRYYIDDIDGAGSSTVTEITEYVQSSTTPLDAETINTTTFAAYGAQSVEGTKRGALQSSVALVLFVDDTTWAIAERLLGRRNLSTTYTEKIGNNASPTTNDVKYEAEMTLFAVKLNHESKKELTMTWELKPSEASSTVPDFGRV